MVKIRSSVVQLSLFLPKFTSEKLELKPFELTSHWGRHLSLNAFYVGGTPLYCDHTYFSNLIAVVFQRDTRGTPSSFHQDIKGTSFKKASTVTSNNNITLLNADTSEHCFVVKRMEISEEWFNNLLGMYSMWKGISQRWSQIYNNKKLGKELGKVNLKATSLNSFQCLWKVGIWVRVRTYTLHPFPPPSSCHNEGGRGDNKRNSNKGHESSAFW